MHLKTSKMNLSVQEKAAGCRVSHAPMLILTHSVDSSRKDDHTPDHLQMEPEDIWINTAIMESNFISFYAPKQDI